MRIGFAAVGLVVGITGAAASAGAAPSCSVEALNALHVPDVSVTEAKPVAAAATTPAYCEVQGTVVTKGAEAADGLARFVLQLPDAWRQRFLFLGAGGNAGSLVPSANVTDRTSALGKGYATILTDTGHVGDGTGAKWTRLPDGKPDTAKMIDFFHRSTHVVTVAGKAFAEAYYAAKVEHAYFDGCSTGGRMAMMEAQRYPEDYQGVIAGDPMMSFHTYTARAVVQKAALSSPAAYIPEATIPAIDARVTKRCDAIDGAQDGLVQSTAACPVKAEDLLCRPGETEACLNADQVRVLKSFTSPFRDSRGRVLFGPWALTDLSGPQGLAFNVTGRAAPDLSDPVAPWKADPKTAPRSWVLVKEALAHWLGLGPGATVADLDIDPDTNTIGDKMLAMMEATYAEGNTRDPARLKTFIAQGRKMILYHGTSDPSIPASQSIAFYRELAERQGGIDAAQKNVRLFLVPGMHHCNGGPGPDRFDTLSALEAWVERGKAPDVIQASTRPESPVQHRLPLCPYPQQARYRGTGELTDPSNWSCAAAATE
ncbi:MAG: tannase/feruloyl esterase family alpha/beta hydrolase [Reyranellaceae bacterium]